MEDDTIAVENMGLKIKLYSPYIIPRINLILEERTTFILSLSLYIHHHFAAAAVAILHVPHRWIALFKRFDARFLIRLIDTDY